METRNHQMHRTPQTDLAKVGAQRRGVDDLNRWHLNPMSPLTTVLLLFTAAHALAQSVHPYVGYDFSETRRTESDHRACITQIFLTTDDYVGYRYREDVFGATTPTVRSLEFSNEYRRKATLAEQAEFVQALLATNVFDLVSEPKPASTDYFCDLDVRIETQEARTSFYSRPKSPVRKAVHDVILQFAHRVKIDHPEDPTKATTVTEGDHQPVRVVNLAEVLAHLDKYHGKRVSVTGFYHGEFEGSSLAVDEPTSRSRNFEHSVWRGGVSTFADRSAINDRNDSWIRVEGVFLRGPGGHMGLWPGELVRITRIEPISPPK
jgi:hypothetical protein